MQKNFEVWNSSASSRKKKLRLKMSQNISYIQKRRWIDMKHLSQSSLENMNRFFMKLFHQIFIWTLLSFRRRKRTITINLSPWEWAHME